MARNNNDRTRTTRPDGTAEQVAAANAQNEYQQDMGLSFVVPTEFVELPSGGKHYPPGHPLHDNEVVEIRHMTAKDEDTLTSRALLKKGLAIDRLLQNILVDKSISSDSLLVGDRNAILVHTRIHAYGADYTTRAMCPSCGAQAENNFNLLEVKHVDNDVSELNVAGPSENGTYMITLPKTGAQAEVRLLSGVDEKQVLRVIENRKKNRLSEKPVTTQMKQYVVSVNGVTDRAQLSHFIENMPTLDAQYMRVAYNKLVPNIDMTLPFICAECGTESRLEVPFTSEFFWPNG